MAGPAGRTLMITSKRTSVILVAFIVADSLLTFAVSAAVLCIFKCDNGLVTAGTIAAGVFAVQSLTYALIRVAAEDLSDAPDQEG